MTEPNKTEVPGLQQWKDRLWEVNRETKSLLMLANITTVEGLVAYIGWHGTKELEAILEPGPYSDLILALQLLKDCIPSPRQVEVINERKEALVTERSALNSIKDMFL